MVALEGKSSKVLCDPWVTFQKKSKTDIYNFPEIAMTDKEISNINPDFIYITHTHSDHFDPDTLCLFNKNTPIIISWYKHNFTARMIGELGFLDIRVSDPEKGIELNGNDKCWINPGTLYPDTDSVGFFKIDDKIVCNFNDNPLSISYVKEKVEKYGPIEIAIIPFAGHGPYPMFYTNLEGQALENKANNKKLKYFNEFIEYIDILKPKYTIPSAGGVVCAGRKALRYKYSGIGTKTDAAEFAVKNSKIKTNIILLSGLNSYDFEADKRHGKYIEKNHANSPEYLSKIAQVKNKFSPGGSFFIDKKEQIDLTKLLSAAREKQSIWQKRKKIISDSIYFFDIGEEFLYKLNLASTKVEKINKSSMTDKKYEIFILQYSLLLGICTGHYIWSNIKTQYIDYYRQPDEFNSNLHFLMNFFHI